MHTVRCLAEANILTWNGFRMLNVGSERRYCIACKAPIAVSPIALRQQAQAQTDADQIQLVCDNCL